MLRIDFKWPYGIASDYYAVGAMSFTWRIYRLKKLEPKGTKPLPIGCRHWDIYPFSRIDLPNFKTGQR